MAKSSGVSLFLVTAAMTWGCGSDSVASQCEDLCAMAPSASVLEGGCVSDFFSARYDTNTDACNTLAGQFGAGQATAGTCQDCAASIGASGSDCTQAQQMCFGTGGGNGADAAGGTIEMSCPEANCNQVCSGGSTCDFSCDGGGCNQTCAAGATCEFDCSGVGCNQTCAENATCTFSCNAGCEQDCAATATSCTFTCTAGCNQNCNDNANCDPTCQQGCA
jgi:hypothetical protein